VIEQDDEEKAPNEIELACLKLMCERSHLDFTRYFFKIRQSIKFRVNWHHHLIADTVQDVIDGKIKNCIINVPPGSSKSEMVGVNFIARGLALNPRARFLYLSYSDDLAMTISGYAQEIISSEEYQALWPMESATDVKAKKRWNITIKGKSAGSVYAVSLGGQITGFRAGHMADGFQGCLIVDDPLKIEDGFSPTKRLRANRQLVATVESRKANPDTPIIIIMQRVAEQDCTGFIKNGGMSGDWHFVNIPAIIDDEYVSKLDPKYQVMVDSSERDEKGRFSYWPYKEPIKSLVQRESGGKAEGDEHAMGRFSFASQYMQNPTPLGGGIFLSKDFLYYDILPPLKWRRIYGDTAQKTAERNDFSVFQCWGLGMDGRLYLIDQIRGKWEAPELKRMAIAFWNKHKAVETLETNKHLRKLQKFFVEDKSSGTGLIQDIKSTPNGGIPMFGIQRSSDKLTRAMDGVPYIESGFVSLPRDAEWLLEYIQEFEAFTADDSHKHDDQIDPTLDAIADNLGQSANRGIFDFMKAEAEKVRAKRERA